jgi:hypothetical protein
MQAKVPLQPDVPQKKWEQAQPMVAKRAKEQNKFFCRIKEEISCLYYWGSLSFLLIMNIKYKN